MARGFIWKIGVDGGRTTEIREGWWHVVGWRKGDRVTEWYSDDWIGEWGNRGEWMRKGGGEVDEIGEGGKNRSRMREKVGMEKVKGWERE
jgi:hypothetical protein